MISRLRRGREAVLAAAGHVDILVNNAGAIATPPGDFRDWTRADDWIKALDANMLTAIELDKSGARSDDRPRIWADREHHIRFSEIANPATGAV